VPIWDIRKITVGGHLPQVLRYIDRIFEEGILETIAASQELGREITQGIVIVDLTGYSTRTHACLACKCLHQRVQQLGLAIYLYGSPYQEVKFDPLVDFWHRGQI